MNWATRVTLFTAAIMALLVGLMTQDQPHLVGRVLLVIALVFVSRDVVDAAEVGAEHSTGLSRLRNPRFWVFLWLNAASFAALLSVFFWKGGALDLRVLGMGAGLGLFIALSQSLFPRGPHIPNRFNLDRPADQRLLGRFVFYGWPVAATMLIVGGVYDPPNGGWQGIYPLFQLILLPFLVPLFAPAGGLVSHWPNHLPRVLGYIVLIIALIVA